MHGIYYDEFTMLRCLKDPTTYSVVEKDKDGRYTRWALLYQDILKFSVFVKDGSSFKERELAKWLLGNNPYYINYYKDPFTRTTTESNRVENILDGIKRERAYDEAYDILQKMLSAEPPASFEILYSTLYKKYRDKNLFAEFVMDPLRRSLESIQEARNMRQLRYTILVMVHTNDAKRNMLRFSLWKEAFNEMKTDIKEILLYNMKADIEQRMFYECKSLKGYEDARLHFRNDILSVVLEAYCKNCNLGYPVALDLIDYSDFYMNTLPDRSVTHVGKLYCHLCKEVQHLINPMLISS
jgi:hypothetical protein